MENIYYFAVKGDTVQSNALHKEKVFPVSVEGSKGILNVFQQVLQILVTAHGLPHHVPSNRMEGGQSIYSFDAANARDEVVITSGNVCDRGVAVQPSRISRRKGAPAALFIMPATWSMVK